jgi:C_GCAxxG_C_C family probable redox protein
MKNYEEGACLKFDEGVNCAQAVLHSFKDQFSISEKTLLGLSAGFGSGFARKEEMCGAISGGVIAIGLSLEDPMIANSEHMEQTYAKTQQLIEAFKNEFGSYLCRDLLGDCNHRSDEGIAAYKANNTRNTVCRKCVGGAAKITANLIS